MALPNGPTDDLHRVAQDRRGWATAGDVFAAHRENAPAREQHTSRDLVDHAVERPTAEINDFIAFCNRVGLPTTLEEVGLGGADRDNLMTAAKAATMPSETIHNMPFPVDAEIVCDAMIAADAYGRAFREAARANEYAIP